MFLERRILGKLKGPETEQFHASQGYLALQVCQPGFLRKAQVSSSALLDGFEWYRTQWST